jgi:hypothetical protein
MTDNASAGATPAAGGATPPQTPEPPATAATTAPAQPATGEPDTDGMTTDAGRNALRIERDARAKAERELQKLQRQTQTESERAVADAKAAGVTEATEKYAGAIRRSEVRSALLAAGVDASLVDLASRADQFAQLEVTDEGEVKGLDSAVDAFKRTTPSLFGSRTSARSGGDTGLGPRGAAPSPGVDMNTLIRRAAGRA